MNIYLREHIISQEGPLQTAITNVSPGRMNTRPSTEVPG